MIEKGSKYLSLLEKGNITPNFYCSQEFIQKEGMKEITEDGYVYLTESGWIVCPPIKEETAALITEKTDWLDKVWSDFPGWEFPGPHIDYFMDHEFLYNPEHFQKMEGGEWQTFRKNCRKFPRRFGRNLHYTKLEPLYQTKGQAFVEKRLERVLINWLESINENKVIHGEDAMLKYLMKGEHRKALYTDRGDIYGVNCWDSNYKFINFRFCFCRDEDYLSEYMRRLFYTDPVIFSQNKLVNDGGSVGNPNLERFKRKLNPLQIREVKSQTLIGYK